MADEEFCGRYKGDHHFDPGENSCLCGRAFKRAPRPAPPARVDTEINLLQSPGGAYTTQPGGADVAPR